jgi:hypothetical protein
MLRCSIQADSLRRLRSLDREIGGFAGDAISPRRGRQRRLLQLAIR